MNEANKEPYSLANERKKPKTVKSFVVYIISSSVIIFFFALEFLTGHHESGEGGSISESLPLPADVSGISAWIINLYNSNKVLFALCVTITMAIVGLILASLTELILRMLGLKVSKISHHE